MSPYLCIKISTKLTVLKRVSGISLRLMPAEYEFCDLNFTYATYSVHEIVMLLSISLSLCFSVWFVHERSLMFTINTPNQNHCHFYNKLYHIWTYKHIWTWYTRNSTEYYIFTKNTFDAVDRRFSIVDALICLCMNDSPQVC